MRYRYYWLDDDYDELFWAEVCNRRWTKEQTDAWGLRFICPWPPNPKADPDWVEYLYGHYGWDDSLLAGTYLKIIGLTMGVDEISDVGRVLGTLGLCYVYSPRACKLFRHLRLGDELEFEDYPLYDAKDRLVGTYFCGRSLVSLDCADEERSFPRLTDWRSPDFYTQTRLVLRRELIGKHRVFLVTNFGRGDPMVMRSDVVEAIRQAGLTGFRFVEAEVV